MLRFVCPLPENCKIAKERLLCKYARMPKKRTTTSKRQGEFLGVWIPVELLDVLNAAVKDLDTDRSKFVRQAVREKIERTRRN